MGWRLRAVNVLWWLDAGISRTTGTSGNFQNRAGIPPRGLLRDVLFSMKTTQPTNESGTMNKNQAANIVAYGGSRPANVSPARWSAIVRHVTRELLNS